MILEKEQIQRYMRHIIMQEIGGAGQKKLLNATVLVCCEDLHASSFMLYYLAAMGIGKIHCSVNNTEDPQDVQNSLHKLNPAMEFTLISSGAITDGCDAIILFNNAGQVSAVDQTAPDIPKILAAVSGDACQLRTVLHNSALNTALEELQAFYNNSHSEETLLYLPSLCLAGALCSIEAVKAILGIGRCFEQWQYIDLANYSFSTSDATKSQVNRFSEQLRNKKVLIVGSGGLGSPAAYILAQMGIGKLGLVDFDVVDISNLNRQILHSTDKLGLPKVVSAKAFLEKLNSNIEICTYQERFSKENAESLVKDYDVIMDGLDNLPTRYLLNDVCYFLKKPLIEAGVLGFNGLATTILPDSGPCYRCTFPEIEDTSSIPSCSETGVLGAVPGVMGALQAVEAVKHLTGAGSTLFSKILMFDALQAEFTLLDIYKEDSCALCGSNPTIDALRDYRFQCENNSTHQHNL